MPPSLVDRYRGALLGLAVGDALGVTLEFHVRDTAPPLTTILGGGRYDLSPGQWTDDTSMALCLADSLVECADFDPADQMRRYLRWFREGHNSSTGFCFDIGNTTADALPEPLAGLDSMLPKQPFSLQRCREGLDFQHRPWYPNSVDTSRPQGH